MPEVGEIKRGIDIGRNTKHFFVWCICPECEEGRWLWKDKRHLDTVICKSCRIRTQRGATSPSWKGGKFKQDGYVNLWLSPDNFFYPMANQDKYILEHRLVFAMALGRCLHSWEEIHHKNGIRDDNRWENLELTTKRGHSLSHSKGYKDGFLKGFIDGRDKRVKELLIEIKALKEYKPDCVRNHLHPGLKRRR